MGYRPARTRSAWLVALSAALSILAVAPAFAAALVDTLVVKYRDDASAASLPAAAQRALGHLQKSAFSEIGRTRDGAFRVAVNPPLAIDDARAAMNRLRQDPDVLYVSIVPRNPAAKAAVIAGMPASERPVRALIVKYKDSVVAVDPSTQRLLPSQLQRVATAAGMPAAHLRTMSKGQYLVQFFKPMSAVGAYEAARLLEQDPDVEYADPDMWRYPTLTPNDTCYPVNVSANCFKSTAPNQMYEWHLMSPPTEPGGANLSPAWDIQTGSPSIYVGVIDTGFLFNHPDLAGRAAGGYDFIYDFALANDSDPAQLPACLQGNDPTLFDPLNPPCVSSRDSDPSDPGDWIDAADQPGNGFSWFAGCPVSPSSWHGSHTSGTIGAATNNSQGIAGINWVSKIVPLRVLGKCGGYSSDIIDAITWGSGGTVAGMGANPFPARVLNLSLGGSGPCSSAEQAAITGAIARGTVVVISAGNTNTDASNNSPGNCLGNITVAATQKQGIKAQYSAYGTSVEIAAPGGGRDFPETPTILRNLVVSTINSGTTTPNPSGYKYDGYNGTSMAAPHVAGVASLMMSVNPNLTPAQVLAAMQSTVTPFPTVPGASCPSTFSCNCTTALCGAGLLNAGGAVAAVLPAVGNGFSAGTTQITSGANITPTVVTSMAAVCPASGILVVRGSGESASKSNAAGTSFIGLAYSIARNSVATDNGNVVQSSALSRFNGDANRDFLNVQRFDQCTPGQTYNYYLTAYATTPTTNTAAGGSFVYNAQLTAIPGPAVSELYQPTVYVTSADGSAPTLVATLDATCPASGRRLVFASGESAAKSTSGAPSFIGLAYSIARNSITPDLWFTAQSSALAIFNGDVNRDFLNLQRLDFCTPGTTDTYVLTVYATTPQTGTSNQSFVYNGRLTALDAPSAYTGSAGIQAFVTSASNATPTIVANQLDVVCPASGKVIVTGSGESAAVSTFGGTAFIGIAYSIARDSLASDNYNLVQSSALATFNGDANRDFINVQRSDTCNPGQSYAYRLTAYATTPQTGIANQSFVYNGSLSAVMLP